MVCACVFAWVCAYMRVSRFLIGFVSYRNELAAYFNVRYLSLRSMSTVQSANHEMIIHQPHAIYLLLSLFACIMYKLFLRNC